MDIAVVWDAAQLRGDWDVTSGDLVTDAGLESLVLILLFTDGLASADWVPTDGTNDRRGTWSDTYEPDPSGSLLWTFNRSAIGDRKALANAVQNTCQTALKILVKYGIATSVTVTTGWVTSNALAIFVSIMKPRATAATKFRFDWAWQGL